MPFLHTTRSATRVQLVVPYPASTRTVRMRSRGHTWHYLVHPARQLHLRGRSSIRNVRTVRQERKR